MNKIKELREKRKMTQEELAEKSGISRATISKLECWEEAETTVGTMQAIANALGVKVSSLFT